MVYLKINDTLYPASLRERVQDADWQNRRSMAITVSMTYAEAASLFVDDVEWGHVYQGAPHNGENGEIIVPDPVDYNDSEYSVAGSITDNRNGTVTVKMGKITDGEALAELREALGV